MALKEEINRILDKKVNSYIAIAILILPMVAYFPLKSSLPKELIIHFGPGAYRYTKAFNAMVLLPIVFLALHLLITYKPDWIGMRQSKLRVYLMPALTIIFYSLSLLLS